MTDRYNNLPELPEDAASYDTSALGRSADSWMDSAVDRSDAAWELEKQRAREWAERHLPFIRLSVRQAS